MERNIRAAYDDPKKQRRLLSVDMSGTAAQESLAKRFTEIVAEQVSTQIVLDCM